ncbi:hypothetical protein ACHAXT_012630 [Thalassiosira profunda]
MASLPTSSLAGVAGGGCDLQLAARRMVHGQSALACRGITPATSFSRPLSTAAASASSSQENASDKSKDGKKEKTEKKDDSNIFLDNLGKIFLSTIGLVLVTLLRSTKANNSRTALREEIEAVALLDPLEIDDLRSANSDFTVEVWERIAEGVRKEFAGREGVTYPEFLSAVVRLMKEEKGEGFTIQLGHLVDRVVIAELERTYGGNTDGAGSLMKRELPLPFLFAALSLALNSTVADRIRILYECLPSDRSPQGILYTAQCDTERTVPGEQVSQMIDHLQRTCQLVPEAQIVETNSKVPFQSYRVGTGDELTKRAREGHGGKKGSDGVTREAEGPVSLEDFHAILRSRTVCAWGECYVKRPGEHLPAIGEE